jgi:DNA ligase-1
MQRAAQLFDELDSTSSTNAKVDALASYFREADGRGQAVDHRDCSAAVGRNGPVTSTQLRQWAAEISGIPDWLFEASYHVVGDFAETVTHIAKLERPITKSLTRMGALRGGPETPGRRRRRHCA